MCQVVGQAKTGSGKTAAFALPILERLSEDPYGIYAIVLTPSRELALQIGEQFTAFSANSGFSILTVVGGMDMMKQSVKLRQIPQVLIATPGRLGIICFVVISGQNVMTHVTADHIRSSPDILSVSALRFLVLDEADRLLDASFSSDLSIILGISSFCSSLQRLCRSQIP